MNGPHTYVVVTIHVPEGATVPDAEAVRRLYEVEGTTEATLPSLSTSGFIRTRSVRFEVPIE